MRQFIKNIVVGLVVLVSVVSAGTALVPATADAAACSASGSFFGLPHWYEGLQHTKNGQCVIEITTNNNYQDIWTIIINIIGILLRLAGIVAVLFIIIGGIRYITSQGESAGITAAKQTITRAIGGLVICISAVLILTFITGTIFHIKDSAATSQVTQ